METSKIAPASIDDYITGVPRNIQVMLRKVQTTIRKAAPGVEETTSYRIPTFKLNGPLIYVAAFKVYLGIYPMTQAIRTKFKKELSGHLSGKSTAKFPFDQPIPYDLIRRIVRSKLQENLKKMKTSGAVR